LSCAKEDPEVTAPNVRAIAESAVRAEEIFMQNLFKVECGCALPLEGVDYFGSITNTPVKLPDAGMRISS
jgi:hypothetical protein